jgi:hypothetical protein
MLLILVYQVSHASVFEVELQVCSYGWLWTALQLYAELIISLVEGSYQQGRCISLSFLGAFRS